MSRVPKGCEVHDPAVVEMAWGQAVREFLADNRETPEDANFILGCCIRIMERAKEIEVLAYATDKGRPS